MKKRTIKKGRVAILLPALLLIALVFNLLMIPGTLAYASEDYTTIERKIYSAATIADKFY